jgi:hypothetical protein
LSQKVHLLNCKAEPCSAYIFIEAMCMTPEQLQQKILEWKKQHEEVYQMTIADKENEFCYLFIFRAIGREEYKQLLFDGLELGEFQEILCQKAVLYPDNYDFSKGLAGIADVLSSAIMDVSGLHVNQSVELLEQFRAELNILDYQADCIIHEAFPMYSLEEIQSWSVRKQMYYLSRAEWILRNLRGVPIELNHESATQSQRQQHQFTFTKEPSAPPKPKDPKEMTEEEVLAMLAENEAKHGRRINWQGNNMDDLFPELAWFQHEDELRGEFD